MTHCYMSTYVIQPEYSYAIRLSHTPFVSDFIFGYMGEGQYLAFNHFTLYQHTTRL